MFEDTFKEEEDMETWTTEIVNKKVFLSSIIGFPDLVACVDIDIDHLNFIFKKKGLKYFEGCKIIVDYGSNI